MKKLIGGAAATALALGAVLFMPMTAANAAAGGCGWSEGTRGISASCNVLTNGSSVRGVITCRLQAIYGGYQFTQYGPWVSRSTWNSVTTCPSNSYYVGHPFVPYQIG